MKRYSQSYGGNSTLPDHVTSWTLLTESMSLLIRLAQAICSCYPASTTVFFLNFTRCITFYYNLYPEIMLKRVNSHLETIFRISQRHQAQAMHSWCTEQHTQPHWAAARLALLSGLGVRRISHLSLAAHVSLAGIVYLLANSVMT